MGRPEAKVFADNISLHTCSSPKLEYRTFVIDDADGTANGKLDPGEEAILQLVLYAAGGSVSATTGRLSSWSSSLAVLDADAEFGPALAGETTVCVTNPFRVRASSAAPIEEAAWCDLILNGDGYEDTVAVPVVIGDSMNLPLGPDRYGHRLFDYTDSAYEQCPDYDWVELRGIGIRPPLGNDETRTVPLPVRFGQWRWYGVAYDSISICSNGWIAAGVTDRPDFVNIILPYEDSPANILAFLWCDLDPSRYGSIRYWHDTAGHRFIVEFDSVPYFALPNQWEKVQIHICDEQTLGSSCDNPVIVHYQTANACSLVTVGFQNRDGTDGLTHVWNSWYPLVSAPIRASSAFSIVAGPSVGVGKRQSSESANVGRLGVYPSPCRRGRPVLFSLSGGDVQSLEITDGLGHRVAQLCLSKGQALAKWWPASLPSGVYFVMSRTPGTIECEKLVLLE